MGWLLHCKTGSMRKYNPSVPCSILLSNKYVIVKAFSRNITGSTNLAYSEKANLQVSVMLPFQDLLSSMAKKSRQNAPTLQQDVVLSIFP